MPFLFCCCPVVAPDTRIVPLESVPEDFRDHRSPSESRCDNEAKKLLCPLVKIAAQIGVEAHNIPAVTSATLDVVRQFL